MKKTSKVLTLVSALALCAGFVGAGVYNLQADADTTTPDVYTHGGSVRKVDPTGLRFLSSVSSEYENAEIGTLIIPKIALGNETLDHNTAGEELSYIDVEKTQWANEAVMQMDGVEYDADRFYFSAVVSPIPDEFIGEVMVARAYVKTESGYVYGDPVERSIAQVAAAALEAGEEDVNDILLGYVDTALANKTLSMNVENSYMVAGATQTLDILNDNNYLATWTSSNENVATVDKYGKVTAVAEGNAKITAKLGSQTFTSKVQVGGAVAGETIVDFTADNVNTIATAVADGNGNGACAISVTDKVNFDGNDVMAVKVTSNYARIKFTLPTFEYLNYEKAQFYAYVEGNNQYVTGAGVVSNGVWTKAEVSLTTNNTFTIDLRENGWNSNKGGLFYISNFCGVNAKSMEKIVDFTAENVTSKVTPGNNITVSSQDGMLKSVYSSYSGNCSMTLTMKESTVFGYDQIQFAVYNAQNKGIGLYINDVHVKDISLGWNYITVDSSKITLASTGLKINIHQSAWNSMANDVYLITDIYGVVSDGVIVDFNADNVTKIVTPGSNTTLSCQDGMLKSTYSSYSGNCSMTMTMKEITDISGYTQIKFAVYNAQDKGIGLYVNSTLIQNITLGWNYVTVDVSALSAKDKLSINIHQSAWNSMANDVYMVSDIYGIK